MIIPSLSQSPLRLSSHAPTPDVSRSEDNRMGSGVGDRTAISSAPSKQDALALFERTLALGYEKLQTRHDAATPFNAFEPLTAEKVAANILGFVERRLQMDMAEGATPEQLQSRLEAALAGFKKGFADASEKLEALKMMSPEVEQDIGKTYELVLTGIDALRGKFLDDLKADPASIPPKTSEHRQAITAMSESSYQYASASSFNFQLITTDGDKVTITASASQTFAAQNFRALTGDDFESGISASYSASNTASWSIQGDLDEGELKAIDALLGQVSRLAAEFFDGNLDEAFNQALALGYDQEQITSFSLNLTQIEVQRVSTAYKQFADSPSNFEGKLSESLLPLGRFVRDLLNALDSAKHFSGPQNLLLDLSEKIVAEDEVATRSPSERFRSFVDQILTSVDQA